MVKKLWLFQPLTVYSSGAEETKEIKTFYIYVAHVLVEIFMYRMKVTASCFVSLS